MKKSMLILLMGAVCISSVIASQPIQLSLTPEIAIHNKSERIEGLALSIWGENPQTGLALGFVNGSTGDSAGLSISLILNYADDYTGVQWAAANYVEGDFLGWQCGFVNYAGGTMKGLQTGWVNYADELNGLQFGFVNYAESADTGLQIGVVNVMPKNVWFDKLPDQLAPGMILVNWSF